MPSYITYITTFKCITVVLRDREESEEIKRNYCATEIEYSPFSKIVTHVARLNYNVGERVKIRNKIFQTGYCDEMYFAFLKL